MNQGKIASEDDLEKAATVYVRNTAMFEDTYHVYYFADQLRERAGNLFKDKDYIKEIEIAVKGRSSDTKWTGEETIE